MKRTYTPKRIRYLSPQQYLKEDIQTNKNVQSVFYELPELGKKGFGRFVVTYKTPVLCLEE